MIQTLKTSCNDLGVVIQDEVQFEEMFLENENSYIAGEIVVIDKKAYVVGSDNKTLFRIRKLTPREAFRLMDVDDNDIDIILNQVSNTQAYKLAGNSIVVNVLVEIFNPLFN